MVLTIRGPGSGYKTKIVKSPAGREIKAGELKVGEVVTIELFTGKIIPPPKLKPKRAQRRGEPR